MASKNGQDFEWCVYYYAALSIPDKAKISRSQQRFTGSSDAVKKAAKIAIESVQEKYGDITFVDKLSGGGFEPKTDILLKTKGNKKIKCSLKYGNSIQLSSGGIKNTVGFLKGVLHNLQQNTKYNQKELENIMSTLTMLYQDYGDLGKMTQNTAKKKLIEAEYYSEVLQSLVGSKKVKLEKDIEDIKLAIIEEAITGKNTFVNKDFAADHILSEKGIVKITPEFIQQVSDKTTVRLRLKGRGKEIKNGEIIRLNEIVVSFDSKM